MRSYLLHLRDQRGVARGTYTPHHGGIRFFFAHTLDREWSLFSKKSPILGRVRKPVPRTAFLLMYACGLRISEPTRSSLKRIVDKLMTGL